MPTHMTVDVWVGLSSSGERLEKYLDEIYDEDDSTPLSEFAGDMGEFFYDHDFFESSFQEIPTQDLRKPLSEHSLAASGVEAVVTAFQTAPQPLNTILLMWNEEDFPQIESPVSVEKEGIQLKYLGHFDGTMRK